MTDRYADPKAVVGESLHEKIRAAKVLMVGAGGIGCELVKNLVLTGFTDITMIDLDTIDVSNLNRQFLFRKEHVGKSKSEIARLSSLAMNPHVQITAHHGNIKDKQFDSKFFKQFTLTLNALDNLEARRYVNNQCRANGLPLIESGTQGYLGQTQPILFGRSECFECVTHPTPKTFAACTIRNTPDKPHHCIDWSSSTYNALFGETDADNIMSDMKMDIKEEDYANPQAYAERVFDKYFRDIIEKQLEAKERWEDRKPPTPVTLSSLELGVEDAGNRAVPSLAQSAKSFVDCVKATLNQRRELIGTLSFDKDDDLSMEFVAAAANLRMHIYSIPMQSAFQVKGIAGNIIHAIATTNAVAAGLIVIEAIKIIEGKEDDCRMTWIKREGPKVLAPQRLDTPNPQCSVCVPMTEVHLNTETSTLQQLYEDVVQGKLGCTEDCVVIDDITHAKDWGYLDDVSDEQREGSLAAVNIIDGTQIRVVDDEKEEWCSLLIVHRDLAEGAFEVKGEVKYMKTEAVAEETDEQPEAKAEDEGPITVDLTDADDGATNKRSLEVDGPAGSNKRAKTVDLDDDDCIEIL